MTNVKPGDECVEPKTGMHWKVVSVGSQDVTLRPARVPGGNLWAVNLGELATWARWSPRHWTDQPKELDGLEVLASMHASGVSIETRLGFDGVTCYVTAGNLFGSETIECPDAHAALRVVGLVASSGRKLPLTVPDGCRLMRAGDAT